MIFVDSNVPMYLVGAPHPHKADAQLLLERAVLDRRRLVTDAEIFQEILHRYVALRRPELVLPAFDALRGVVDEVFSIGLDDVEVARRLLLDGVTDSARDAIHVAVMRRQGLDEILTFDRGFDGIDGIRRSPADRRPR